MIEVKRPTTQKIERFIRLKANQIPSGKAAALLRPKKLDSRKAKPLENFFSHIRADAFVLVKMDAAGLFVARRRHWLGNIMHQYRPRQQRVSIGRHLVQHEN